MIITHEFSHCILRASSLCLEQKQDNAHQPITLSDLLPKEVHNIRGKYKITIEFEEEN